MKRPAPMMLIAAAALSLTALNVPAATAASGNLLRNPGFEQSLTSNAWKGQDCCVTTSDPHSGAWIATMGSTGSTHTDKITQQVSIPTADGATLTFWVKVWTEESAGNTDDTFRARVTTANGTTRTVKSLSSSDGSHDLAGPYVKYTAQMSRYTGKTVKVSFVATEDQGNRTDFQLDDTALRTS